MGFKKSLILLFTILILTQVFALDCQYKQLVFDHIETKLEAYSKDTDDEIEPITYSFTGTEKAPLYFFNENDFNVDIEYDLGYYCSYTRSDHYSRTLVPGTNEVAFFCNFGRYIWLSNLAYRENEFVYLKNKEEKIYKEICLLCGDKNCLDDGRSCEINNECGSGYCIEKICSSTKDVNGIVICNNKDCNCNSSEIEFEDRDCIPKNSVAIGGTPITGNTEECVTNYISPMTGKCAVALGDACNKNSDCAENYCVLGTCSSNSITCYNNNCNCKENEIQFENRTCILKHSKDSGEKTITGNKLECVSNIIDADTNICKSVCNDNQISYQYSCINKKSEINGVIPQTENREECKSEYINPKTGKCSMTPETQSLIWITIIFILLACIVFFLFYILKNKQENEEKELDLKKIEKEIENSKEKVKISELEYKTEKSKKEKIERKLDTLNKDIDSIKKEQDIYILQLKRLKNLENKTAIESEKIEAITKKLKNKAAEIECKKKEREQEEVELKKSEQEIIRRKKSLEQQNKELENQEKKNKEIIEALENQKIIIDTLAKPHRNKQNQLVIVNKAGYEERLDGKLFHRWWYSKHYGPIKPGYDVHHIDGKPLNNDIKNLIAIPEDIHKFKINHDKICDRKSGLEELRKKGINI